jgi:hypothetical protein
MRYWDWQSAYRNFELLQQLPFDYVCSCSCRSICGDGTSQAIRFKHLDIQAHPAEDIDRPFVKFQQHTLFKTKSIRDMVNR